MKYTRSKKQFIGLTFLALGGLTFTSLGQTIYTWTGAASGDWADATNWDANGVPVDNNGGTGNNAGLSFPTDGSQIVFDGGMNPLPTSNIPDLGGNTNPRDTPEIVVNQGGAITFNLGGREGAVWSNSAGARDILVVGDGIGAAGEVAVTLSSSNAIPNLARHADNSTNNFQVNADGILTFTSGTVDFGWQAGERHSVITIDGGQVNFDGVVDDLVTFTQRVIEFTSIGGTFTAQYGGDFADIAAVNASLNIDFVSALGIDLNTSDNGTSFTVTSIGGSTGSFWTGTGGATWDQSTTLNFTTNDEGSPLVIDTFDNGFAIQRRVIFADQFFGQAVTENNILIAAGGVSDGSIIFTNNAIDYTLTGVDATGLTGTAQVSLLEDGSVTFNSPQTYTGSTNISEGSSLFLGDGSLDGSLTDSVIINDGALTFNNLGAVIQEGALSGTGTLEKLGNETLILNGGSTLAGGTTVSAGTLVVNGQVGSGGHTIASGAVLELFYDEAALFNYAGNTTISGDGILRKTGSGESRWAVDIANFELSSDALIDIQGGILRGGSNTNEVWTNNFSDLNVAAGATFRGTEANVRVDVLTGDGLINTGFDAVGGGYETFTIGVDNGSGTFDGVLGNTIDNADVQTGNFTKVGTGTQTLTGLNTYRGDTTVEAGTLTVTETGQLNFTPQANGVNGLIAGVVGGTGTINIDGAFFFDLTQADTTAGNSWFLVDESNITVNYGADFTVNSSAGAFTNNGDVWTLSANGNSWNFDRATGILTLAGGSYNIWAASFGLTGDDALETADPDGDSVDNLLEFAFGTDPTSPELGVLFWDGVSATATTGSPAVETSGCFLARFFRRQDQGTPGNLSYAWEFSSDLIDWESSADDPSWFTNPIDRADDVTGDYDLVEVPFPLSLDNGEVPRFFRVTVSF